MKKKLYKIFSYLFLFGAIALISLHWGYFMNRGGMPLDFVVIVGRGLLLFLAYLIVGHFLVKRILPKHIVSVFLWFAIVIPVSMTVSESIYNVINHPICNPCWNRGIKQIFGDDLDCYHELQKSQNMDLIKKYGIENKKSFIYNCGNSVIFITEEDSCYRVVKKVPDSAADMTRKTGSDSLPDESSVDVFELPLSFNLIKDLMNYESISPIGFMYDTRYDGRDTNFMLCDSSGRIKMLENINTLRTKQIVSGNYEKTISPAQMEFLNNVFLFRCVK